MTNNDILIADTVTKFGPEAAGKVVIAGSHGGVYAGYEAARAGVLGVILHDAAVGLDEAGIGALAYLDRLGFAAATVDYRSAVIGNGDSMSRNGVISFVNGVAAEAGCEPGQSAMACAMAMRHAPGGSDDVPDYEEARFVIREAPGEAKVWGCDSVSLVRAEDEGAIVITASHGELLATSPTWGQRPDVLAAVFNDAGASTVTRLPDLDTRKIAGATVAAASARIGDAKSTYEDGIITHLNETAAALGASRGSSTIEFVDLLLEVSRSR